MKVQHRINNGIYWESCSSVTLVDEVLHCTLDPSRSYALVEAYEASPHVHFANAGTDDELIEFIRTWGPLYVPNSQLPANGAVTISLTYCRLQQQWLRALVQLLTAFKNGFSEKEALLQYLKVEEQNQHNSGFAGEAQSFQFLRRAFGVSANVLEWAVNANLRTVRAATDIVVPLAQVHPILVNLTCRRERGSRYIEAGWKFRDLGEALRWMVWYDEFTQHPIVCCKECRKVFRGETAHARKYCPDGCAHRATARNWQRKKRAAEKRKQ